MIQILKFIQTYLSEISKRLKLLKLPDISVLLRTDRNIRLVKPFVGVTQQLKRYGYGTANWLETTLSQTGCLPRHLNNWKKHYDKYAMPFHPIPNCSTFIAQVGLFDWLFGIFGYSVKFQDRSALSFKTWKNTNANKFLVSVFLQLRGYVIRGEYDNYWKLSRRIMKSHVYLVCAFLYVHSSAHRLWPEHNIKKVLAQVRELIDSEATQIDYYRRYIPKGIDKVRPLGVPTPAWRVYLHMHNNFLVWWRQCQNELGSQHAYLPKRSCSTAWKEIFDNLPNYKYIYEFDLKGFFDNVSLSSLEKFMREEFRIPPKVAHYYKTMNQSIVKLEEQDQLFEPDRHITYNADLSYNQNLSQKKLDMMKEETQKALDAYSSGTDIDAIVKLWTNSGKREIEPTYYHNEDGTVTLTNFWTGLKEKGVPQGAPTSCSLSTVVLHKIVNLTKYYPELQCKVIMYADDGIILLNNPEELSKVLSAFQETGVEVNHDKSGWIKGPNGIEKPLKFLGLEYDLITKRIKAKTRKGSSLEFSKSDQFLSFLLSKREELSLEGSAAHLNTLKSLENVSVYSWITGELKEFLTLCQPEALLFNGPAKGKFLSMLYNGSRYLENPTTKSLIYRRGSWCKRSWPSYRQEQILTDWNSILMSEISILSERIYRPESWTMYILMGVWDRIKHFRLRLHLSRDNITRLTQMFYLIRVKHILEKYEGKVRRSSFSRAYTEAVGELFRLELWNSRTYFAHDLLTGRMESRQHGLIRYVEQRPLRLEPKPMELLEKNISKEFRKVFKINPILRDPITLQKLHSSGIPYFSWAYWQEIKQTLISFDWRKNYLNSVREILIVVLNLLSGAFVTLLSISLLYQGSEVIATGSTVQYYSIDSTRSTSSESLESLNNISINLTSKFESVTILLLSCLFLSFLLWIIMWTIWIPSEPDLSIISERLKDIMEFNRNSDRIVQEHYNPIMPIVNVHSPEIAHGWSEPWSFNPEWPDNWK